MLESLQVEVTLNFNQKRLIDFCKKYDITVTGYSPLGKSRLRPWIKNAWLDPKVQELSKKYGKTPAQICLRFVVSFKFYFNFRLTDLCDKNPVINL